MSVARSAGCDLAPRACGPPPGLPRGPLGPRARTSSRESVPVATAGSSMRMTCCRCGELARGPRRPSRACAAFETKSDLGLAVVQDVEHLRGRQRSGRWARRPRAAHSVARSAKAHSGRFSERMRDAVALARCRARAAPSTSSSTAAPELVGADVAPRAVALVAELVRPFEAIDGSVEELAERLDGHSAERRRGARPE